MKIREFFNKVGDKITSGYGLFIRFRCFFEETVIKGYSLSWEEEIYNSNTAILLHDVSAVILQGLAIRYAQDSDNAEDTAYKCATSIIDVMRDILREEFGDDLDVEEIEIISNRAALIKEGIMSLVENDENKENFVSLADTCSRVGKNSVKFPRNF